jgi:hypothetical protein
MGGDRFCLVDRPASFFDYFCLLLAFVSQSEMSPYIGCFWRIPLALVGTITAVDQIILRKLRVVLVFCDERVVGGFALRKGMVESGTFPDDPALRFRVMMMIARRSYEILKEERSSKFRGATLNDAMGKAFLRSGFVVLDKEWFVVTLRLGYFTISWLTKKRIDFQLRFITTSGPMRLYEYRQQGLAL